MKKQRTESELINAGYKLVSFNPPIYARRNGERIAVFHREGVYVKSFDGKREYLPSNIEKLIGDKLDGNR